MAEGGSECADAQSLQDLFKGGWDVQKRVEKDDLDSTSDEFRDLVLSGVGFLEKATHHANQLSLFSSNEAMEDIATSDLKYLLLPALLGDLTLQISGEDRVEVIQKARVYLVDYLQRCRSYAITTEDPPIRCDHTSSAEGPAPPPRKTYDQISAERTARIARLKEQKEMERKLKELTVRVELSLVSPQHRVDEEVLRDHALSLLRLWVYRCQDHVRSIDQEVELLEGMRKRGGAKGSETAPLDPPRLIKPFKPVVITKEMLQSKVFGAGYPSLPVMSVEEFYDQKYKEELEQRKQEVELARRVVDDSMVGGARGRKEEGEEEEEDEDAAKENAEETEEGLQRARDWDEFKDDNRFGWGNKKNMG